MVRTLSDSCFVTIEIISLLLVGLGSSGKAFKLKMCSLKWPGIKHNSAVLLSCRERLNHEDFPRTSDLQT
jgi:hypothetical protein